jgi:hypothetical protein
MKKFSLYISLFAFMAIGLAGCFNDREIIYSGPDLAEFKNQHFGRTAATLPAGMICSGTAGTTSASACGQTMLSRTVRASLGQDTILVQLVGPQKSSESTASFTVEEYADAAFGANGFAAVEGTHYNFVSPKGTLTIPANSSVGYLIISTVAGSIPTATERRSVRFTITEGGSLKPSENYKTFTYHIRS